MSLRNCTIVDQTHRGIDSGRGGGGCHPAGRFPSGQRIPMDRGAVVPDGERKRVPDLQCLKPCGAHTDAAQCRGSTQSVMAGRSSQRRYRRPWYRQAIVESVLNTIPQEPPDGGWHQEWVMDGVRKERTAASDSQGQDEDIVLGDVDDGGGLTRVPLQQSPELTDSCHSGGLAEDFPVDHDQPLTTIARACVHLRDEAFCRLEMPIRLHGCTTSVSTLFVGVKESRVGR